MFVVLSSRRVQRLSYLLFKSCSYFLYPKFQNSFLLPHMRFPFPLLYAMSLPFCIFITLYITNIWRFLLSSSFLDVSLFFYSRFYFTLEIRRFCVTLFVCDWLYLNNIYMSLRPILIASNPSSCVFLFYNYIHMHCCSRWLIKIN